MGRSLSSSAVETLRESLPSPSGRTAQASLHPKEPESQLRELAKDAIQREIKQGAAAAEIGISEGRLSAKLGDGTISLKELEKLGITFAVVWAEEILRQHGALVTPQQRARQKLREARQALEELDQYLEHIA